MQKKVLCTNYRHSRQVKREPEIQPAVAVTRLPEGNSVFCRGDGFPFRHQKLHRAYRIGE
jgi:hypothetical protein